MPVPISQNNIKSRQENGVSDNISKSYDANVSQSKLIFEIYFNNISKSHDVNVSDIKVVMKTYYMSVFLEVPDYNLEQKKLPKKFQKIPHLHLSFLRINLARGALRKIEKKIEIFFLVIFWPKF